MKHEDKIMKVILAKLEQIEKNINSKKNPLDDFISEHEAKKKFKKGTTWFWNLRQKEFTYTKFGGEVYYSLNDLYSFLQKNKQGGDY